MTSLYDLPSQPLQFYLTAAYPCSYLEGKEARSQVLTPGPQISATVFSTLVERGFRRSGLFTYRPSCQACQACIPVRVAVHDFAPNRSQRRAWRRHQTLQARECVLQFDEEHFKLYAHYQQARHLPDTEAPHGAEQYRQFLLQSSVTTKLVEFRQENQLVMVSLIDRLNHGLSSVYTFYDPEQAEAGASLGTFNILWQIAECRRLHLDWLYLGYWIQHSPKMSYKQRFQPLEAWYQGAWVPFDALHDTPAILED